MWKQAFKSILDIVNYYDNCIYEKIELYQVLNFDLHDLTAIIGMIYKQFVKYTKNKRYGEREKLRLPLIQNK